MSRLARVVVPGLPHHVTQRGNRREATFFEAGDYAVYRDLFAQYARKHGVAVWAYCLMPNHVHLILVPSEPAGLARVVGGVHRRYTNYIHARTRWVGHLFQSRFASVVMDEAHLFHAIRYVSVNPVRAGLVARADDWPWSSVRAHLAGRGDGLVDVAPVLERMPDFAERIAAVAAADESAWWALRRAETSGRPLGSRGFMLQLEQRLGRVLACRSPGRPPKKSGNPYPVPNCNLGT